MLATRWIGLVASTWHSISIDGAGDCDVHLDAVFQENFLVLQESYHRSHRARSCVVDIRRDVVHNNWLHLHSALCDPRSAEGYRFGRGKQLSK